MNTRDWAKHNGVSTLLDLPPATTTERVAERTSVAAARRVLITHAVVAVAAGAEAEPIRDWLVEQGLMDSATPREVAALNGGSLTDSEATQLSWHMEAEWTLLWALGKVESLGLPTGRCDSGRLVDELIPPLGSDTAEFVSSCRLRGDGELLAEDERTYNLWCYAQKARRAGRLPEDLELTVLYERRYAFEWLTSSEAWDDIQCDA